MTPFQKDIISIIRSAFTSKIPNLSDGVDYSRIYNFAVKHQIVCILYEGLVGREDFKADGIYQKFYMTACGFLSLNMRQQHELSVVKSEFEKNGIDYALIKGSVIREYYPRPELRTMGDADVLIKEKQRGKIEQVMNACGFVPNEEDSHTTVWDKKNRLHLELHKHLLPPESDLFGYYKNREWSLMKNITEHGYGMSHEDMFIYIMLHFVKHFRFSGAGVRNIIDFYVYFEHFKDLDEKYIYGEFEKLGLCRFYDNIKLLIKNWFYGGEETEITNKLTEMLFTSGIYGNMATNEKSSAALYSKKYKHGRLVRLREMIFPNVDTMKRYYPVTERAPILLPFMYVARWFAIIFKRPENIKRAAKTIGDMTDEMARQRNAELESVGLKIYFKQD